MSEPHHIELPLPPLGNHRNGINLRTGQWYPNEETKKYRRLVQLSCVGMRPIEGNVSVGVDVYRHPGQRGDIDGYLKCLLDHLQGFAYSNDSKIKRLGIEIHEDGAFNPRVDVWVYSYGPPLGKSVELPPPPTPKRQRASLKPNTYRRKGKGA